MGLRLRLIACVVMGLVYWIRLVHFWLGDFVRWFNGCFVGCLGLGIVG